MMKVYLMEHGNDTNRFGVAVRGGPASWEDPHRMSGIQTKLQEGLKEALNFYRLLSEETSLNLDDTWACAREYEGGGGSFRQTGIVYVLKASNPATILVKRGRDIVEQLQI